MTVLVFVLVLVAALATILILRTRRDRRAGLGPAAGRDAARGTSGLPGGPGDGLGGLNL